MEQKIKHGPHTRENYMHTYFTPPTTHCMNIGNFTSSPSARSLNEMLGGFAEPDVKNFATYPNFTSSHIAHHVSGKIPSKVFPPSRTTYTAFDEYLADDNWS